MCLADRLHSRWVLLAYSHRWRDWRDAGGAVERLRMVDLADPQPRRREQQRPDGRFVRSADRLHRCRRLLPDLRAVTLALVERWEGTSWSIQPTPNPAGTTESLLTGVSFAAPTACTAVAVCFPTYGAVTLAMVERWDGASWSIQLTPNPTGETFIGLAGVSCPSPTACTAVGNSPGGTMLAEHWNGRRWSIQLTPNPTYSSLLNDVSCVSTTACTAVGAYSGGALVERWNGRRWSIQRTPNPAGGTNVSLNGVSCASNTACTAVAHYNNRAGRELTLVERWDGTSWSIQRTPNPVRASKSSLTGVSCASPTVCTAVGS